MQHRLLACLVKQFHLRNGVMGAYGDPLADIRFSTRQLVYSEQREAKKERRRVL